MSYLTFIALLNVLWKGLFHVLLQLRRIATSGQKNLTDEHKRFRNIVSKQPLGKFIFYLDTSRGGRE